ncbi:MAG: hypothetical protein PHH30_06535 [Bacteroidales bacterium]|nr:hypothetical protein [Bacteroidales bacterium]
MTICTSCILNDKYPGIKFNDKGECSLCTGKRTFSPFGEDKLIEIFDKAKAKNAEFDALVPLSGGKDSTYILYLATKVYKLKVLAMTYDNGLFSQTALDNIERALKITGVKHIWCKTDPVIQKKVYRNMLLKSGDICGACDIATISYILKTAQDYKTPLILYGTSPLEEDSFVPDSIQDISRFKHILKDVSELKTDEINKYLVLPSRNDFNTFIKKKSGKIGLEVRPLFYIDNPTDKEMGEIIARELGWQEDFNKDFTKHFDCIAEPFTNYVRHSIYGYERHICQYSNMVRSGEISREKALQLYESDMLDLRPANYNDILSLFDISEKQMGDIVKIRPLKYERYTSKINKLFLYFVKLKQKLS